MLNINNKKKLNKNAGYTVVELLAVVTILVIVTGIISALITQTLRGSSKTNITNQVSQAGNYATTVISNTIISAENVVAVNGEAVIDCTQNPTGTSIELLISKEVGTVLYACANDNIASNSAFLIDKNKLMVDSDDTSACYFRCLQQNNDPYTPPIIEFGFRISQKAQGALFENKESALFETSVLMRNYRPQ